MLVINLLKMVDVQQAQAKLLPVALGMLHLLTQLAQDCPSIKQPG